jgi:hypothetical protein
MAISAVTARADLFARGDTVGVDIPIQVTDSKQTSAPSQNRRYFASTHHPVNRSERLARLRDIQPVLLTGCSSPTTAKYRPYFR